MNQVRQPVQREDFGGPVKIVDENLPPSSLRVKTRLLSNWHHINSSVFKETQSSSLIQTTPKKGSKFKFPSGFGHLPNLYFFLALKVFWFCLHLWLENETAEMYWGFFHHYHFGEECLNVVSRQETSFSYYLQSCSARNEEVVPNVLNDEVKEWK